MSSTSPVQAKTPTIRCLVIGETGVGKSTFCLEYFRPGSSLDGPVPRVVEPYSPYRSVFLQVWDSSGWDEFLMNDWGQGHFDVLLLCFSLESSESLRRAKARWSNAKKSFINFWHRIPVVLVGLKADLRSNKLSTVRDTQRRATDFLNEISVARRIGGYIEASARTGGHVKETFHAAIHAGLLFKNVLLPPPPKPEEIGSPDLFRGQSQALLKGPLQSLQQLSNLRSPPPKPTLILEAQYDQKDYWDELPPAIPPKENEASEEVLDEKWSDPLFIELISVFEMPSSIPLTNDFSPHEWMKHLLRSTGLDTGPIDRHDIHVSFTQYTPATASLLSFQLQSLQRKGIDCTPPDLSLPEVPLYSSKDSLPSILHSQVQRKQFYDFLISTFANENLDFMCAVGAYKKVRALEMRKKRAAIIFEKYIRPDSPRQINIRSETLKKTQESYTSGRQDAFDIAYNEVSKILSSYCLPEFLGRVQPTLIPSPQFVPTDLRAIQNSFLSCSRGLLLGYHNMNIAPEMDTPNTVIRLRVVLFFSEIPPVISPLKKVSRKNRQELLGMGNQSPHQTSHNETLTEITQQIDVLWPHFVDVNETMVSPSSARALLRSLASQFDQPVDQEKIDCCIFETHASEGLTREQLIQIALSLFQSASKQASDSLAHVWVVRHGERMDEANRKWKSLPQNDKFRSHDAPLTEKGQAQATLAGNLLLEQSKTSDIKFSHIASSPMLRTVMTAECIAAILKQPVTIATGLSACCAAVRKFDRNNFETKASFDFYPPEFLQQECPTLTFQVSPNTTETFLQSAVRFSIPGEHVILVSHREGIRELASQAGLLSIPTPYCLVTHFTYDATHRQWALAQKFPIPRAPKNPRVK